MNKSLSRWINLSRLLSSVFFVFSCSNPQEQKENSNVLVSIEPIQINSQVYSQEYIGTVESENAVDVSFLSIGNIEQMYVQEGQKVSKGQLLAMLNTTSLKSTHDVTVATLKQAEDAYKRMTDMFNNKSLPEIQYIDVKTKLEQAKAAEAIARKSLQDGQLYAPQSGVIGKKFVEPGANVMPGTPVYTIMDISSIKVRTAIPEGEISDIQNGVKCEVKISALNNETFDGTVIEKGVSANQVSHTYDIKIKINNTAGKIMPGMVCRVYIKDGKEAGGIVVPLKSVQVDHSGKRFVWLKDKQNKAIYKEVTLGSLVGNGVQIISGLQVGDELITAGYQNISDGANVSVNK